MKKLIILLNLCAAWAAFADESTSKIATRPFKWESAVKPDAPPPSVPQAGQVTFAEVASKVSSIPLYYSAQRNVPALPFNPRPELPLFDIGENKFVYDDTMFDYSALFAGSALTGEGGGEMSMMSSPSPCNPCSTNGSGGGSSFSGPPAYSYVSTNLWVKITSTNATNFLLDVNNTVPGTVYGVGVKSSVDSEPFNTWTLAQVFVATSTNKQFAGTASNPTRFYNAVNLDTYTGPSVSIVSPADGTTVNDDVPVRVAITDILPLRTVEVYVGAVQVGMIEAGQNGLVNIPSRWFANGSHQIWVRAVNEGVAVDTDGNNVADSVVPFEGWGSVTLNFSNSVSVQNYSPLYSTGGSMTLQYTVTSKQDYIFEVFKTNGILLHTASGESVNGSISRTWNFTNLSGQPVDDGVYVSSLTYSPHGAAALGPGRIFATFRVDQGVTVGKCVISYGQWPGSTINTGMENLALYLSVGINEAAYFDYEIIGIDREAYGIIYSDRSGEPFRIRQATQTNDILALTNALKNPITGSWFFMGHAGGVNMIHGHDQHLTVDLTSRQVAAVLGTTLVDDTNGLTAKYGRRLFSTIIAGCGSTSGEYPTATGTPPGVQQVGNSQIKKSVFLGFNNTMYVGATNNSWNYAVHAVWADGNDYDTPLSDAVAAANNAYPSVLVWKPTIYGHRFLQYNANESR